MALRKSAVSTLLFSLALTAVSVGVFAEDQSRGITLSENLQVPGAVLKPGSYTFSVEDRMKDRAIVRITSEAGNKHFLLLSVPSDKLSGQAQNGLFLFQSRDHKNQVLRGWMCPGCSTALEFVYPKLEAAKITDSSTESVLAVDPESDKLPAKLSPDDMKVVTLWLLSPERITASNKGEGVRAEQYSGALQAAAVSAAPQVPASTVPATPQVPESATPEATSSTATASAQTPASAVTETAPAPQTRGTEMARAASSSSQQEPRNHLPKTAGNTFSLALWGLLSMIAWAAFFTSRRGSRRRRA